MPVTPRNVLQEPTVGMLGAGARPKGPGGIVDDGRGGFNSLPRYVCGVQPAAAGARFHGF